MLALRKSTNEPYLAPARSTASLAAAPTNDPLSVESFIEFAQRWALGIAYALHPQRLSSIPHLMFWCGLDLLRGGTLVPDQNRTRSRPDTFGGIVRGLTTETYLAALRLGFFPWAHCGPLKWWTRRKRMVLFLPELHANRRLKRLIRSGRYRVTFDTAFDDVLTACSAPRTYNWHALTWLTPAYRKLFSELHRQGHAHSFEVWNADGELVGGGFGTAIGRVFVGESMFSREPNTSKVGCLALYARLANLGFHLVDARDYTSVLARTGYREIPRAEFEALLAEHAHATVRSGSWV